MKNLRINCYLRSIFLQSENQMVPVSTLPIRKIVAYCFLLLFSTNLIAQTPISHQPGVTFTHSGSYYVAGGGASVNFVMCDSWNSGTYGGWLQMDLGSAITLESLRWWVGMLPNGNVASELIEVSADGVNWTLAANTSGPHVLFEEIKLLFDPVIPNVRYIRISQSGTPSWFSIPEMIVNEPYYAENIYYNMPPKILDNSGNELTAPVAGFPYTFKSSKASTYQWSKNGVQILGATDQEYLAPDQGSYTCAVTYSTTNCGFVTSSSAISLMPALPVELISFSGRAQNEHTVLHWEAANFINFSHFDIERSIDGIAFKTIGQMPSKGDGTYIYVDKDSSPGINYYRLKQVDHDGSFDFSTIVPIKTKGLKKVSIFPNPNHGVLNFDFSAFENKGVANVSIYNSLGALVVEKSIPSPDSHMTLHLPALQGIHFVKIENSNMAILEVHQLYLISE